MANAARRYEHGSGAEAAAALHPGRLHSAGGRLGADRGRSALRLWIYVAALAIIGIGLGVALL